MTCLQDDELDDEEDKSLLADESSHIEDESLLSTSSHSTKAEVVATATEAQPEKKIILKRAGPITAPAAATTTTVTAEPETTGTEEPSPKVAKLTQLTAAERLELRTKKFGGAAVAEVNTDLKRQARAERFGIKTVEPAKPTTDASKAAATNNNNKIDTSTAEPVSVEVLKKRAERFGTVSSKLVSVENAEKLAKRQGRFGVTAPSPTTEKADAESPAAKDYAERAKMRLERFKQEVK